MASIISGFHYRVTWCLEKTVPRREQVIHHRFQDDHCALLSMIHTCFFAETTCTPRQYVGMSRNTPYMSQPCLYILVNRYGISVLCLILMSSGA